MQSCPGHDGKPDSPIPLQSRQVVDRNLDKGAAGVNSLFPHIMSFKIRGNERTSEADNRLYFYHNSRLKSTIAWKQQRLLPSVNCTERDAIRTIRPVSEVNWRTGSFPVCGKRVARRTCPGTAFFRFEWRETARRSQIPQDFKDTS